MLNQADLDNQDRLGGPLSPVDFWRSPAVIQPNNFVFKSLSQWAFNVAVGCSHACRFCYVPSAATIKQGPQLRRYGVRNPDEEWGDYVLVRSWDEALFLRSLKTAERLPAAKLKRDGNRAVIYCSTTDPYQVIRHPVAGRQRELSHAARELVRRSLELIRDRSTLNVRILTRSPLARQDFDLFRSFGPRLVFGMSLPTTRNDLARIYEPRAPSPSQRLAALRAAKDAGLNVYVAMAPTYPECDESDLCETLRHIAALDPITIFHEPINIRAENVQRIESMARSLGVTLRTEAFADAHSWRTYAVNALKTVERISRDFGVYERLHLWPDKALGSRAALVDSDEPTERAAWLQQWWSRVSEWPGGVCKTLAHTDDSL